VIWVRVEQSFGVTNLGCPTSREKRARYGAPGIVTEVSNGLIDAVPDLKPEMGCAHYFCPTWTSANVGHRCDFLAVPGPVERTLPMAFSVPLALLQGIRL
jgi:hypothetical protein